MNLSDIKNEDGTFPAYAWPGGYPVVYILEDGDALCADCANGKNGSEAWVGTDEDERCGDGWRIIGHDIHWEGPPEICSHCGIEIPSAYGDPEEEEEL